MCWVENILERSQFPLLFQHANKRSFFINHPFLPQVRTLNQRKGGFPGDITNESSIVVARVAVTCQLYIRKLMEIKGPHWTWVLFSGSV